MFQTLLWLDMPVTVLANIGLGLQNATIHFPPYTHYS